MRRVRPIKRVAIMDSIHLHLAKQIADLFAALPQVEAVALGGSRAGGASDAASDIDLYVYTQGAIPVETRRSIVDRSGGAAQASLDLNYWGPGDEWYHAPTGIEIDIVYFDAAWMQDQIDRVIDRHQASLGYTTCFWHTVRHSILLHDRRGWFSNLQEQCRAEYPEPLRHNIITLNRPVLRGVIPAYAHQLEKAVARRDLISINHRLAALFASYFDILFALNRQLHPGEKRLVELAVHHCAHLPTDMEQDITAILQAAATITVDLPALIDRLLDRLDALLEDECAGP
jgi:hypothetical protein